MMKTTGKGSPETYFTMMMEGAFITKVSNSGTEEGNVVQKVELVFKTVKIEYKPQDNKTARCSRPRPTTGTFRPARHRRRPDLGRAGSGRAAAPRSGSKRRGASRSAKAVARMPFRLSV
jgi:hypothetical protein